MSTVRLIKGEASWLFEAGRESLLDEAVARGVPVSYSCKRGDCAQCLATVLEGRVQAMDASRPLERDGRIYLCNAEARGDLTIKIEHIPELDDIPLVRTPCKIQEVVRLSSTVIEVSFRLPAASRFKFLAGQYIRLTNKERITRSYSLAHAPSPDELLHIHVRRVDGGAFSRYLFDVAKPGDLLHLEGPMGGFIMRRAGAARKTLFAATGTGIAPVHAILSSLNAEQIARCGDVFIYWGNRSFEDAYFTAKMRAQAQRTRASYFEVYSRASHRNAIAPGSFPPGDDALPRHVQELVKAHHSELLGARVFSSGNPAMIDEMRNFAVSLGLDIENYHSDAFTRS